MGTGAPYFICLDSLLLYLNLHVLQKKDFGWSYYQHCAGNVAKSKPFRK